MSYLIAVLRKPGYNAVMTHRVHAVREIPVSQLEAAIADEARTNEAAMGSR